MYIHSTKQTINKLSDFKRADELIDELQNILRSDYEFHTHVSYGDICRHSTHNYYDNTRYQDVLNTN